VTCMHIFVHISTDSWAALKHVAPVLKKKKKA